MNPFSQKLIAQAGFDCACLKSQNSVSSRLARAIQFQKVGEPTVQLETQINMLDIQWYLAQRTKGSTPHPEMKRAEDQAESDMGRRRLHSEIQL